MCDDDRRERVEECSMCGDEACSCCEVCDTCKGWKPQCSCQEAKCKCGALMAKIYSQGEFKEFCPVCRPDPFDRAEDQRMDAQDILNEMEVDDGYTN